MHFPARPRLPAALAVVCLSVFVVSVDATIVNVALPTLARQLAADTAALQWVVDAYTLALSGLLLSAGSLADRYGRRGWLVIGVLIFAVASAAAARAGSVDMLIAARAVMGVGAAVIFPTTLGLISNIYTDPAARAKAIAAWAAMTGIGVAVGPISGGWLLAHFAWGAIFLVNIPIAAMAIVGAWLFVPTSRDPAAPALDAGGLILSTAGITVVVYTAIRAPGWGWTGHATLTGFAAGLAVLTAFAWWERRRVHPMLDLSVFANRRFSGGSLAVTASFLTLFGFIFVITQYFQFIRGYTALTTGVRLLPVAMSIAAASIAGPRVVERVGSKIVVAAGLAVFSAGLAWASTVDASTPYIEIAAQMLLFGGGLGLTFAPATDAVMGSLDSAKAGVGAAVNSTARELGGTLGVAIIGSVFASVYAARLAGDQSLANLPVHDREVMGQSVAAAYTVLGHLPPRMAATVGDAVQHAFIDGLRIGTLMCAGVAFASALATTALLPARAAHTTPAGPGEAVASTVRA